MTTTATIAERRAAVIDRLREGRALITDCLKDMKPEEARVGSSWGVMDAINHMIGRPIYLTFADRLLNEENPQLPGMPGPGGYFQRAQDRLLASIDDTIAYVEGLSEEQLARSGRRGDDPVQVIDFLENASRHYIEHGTQIRDEILPAARGRT